MRRLMLLALVATALSGCASVESGTTWSVDEDRDEGVRLVLGREGTDDVRLMATIALDKELKEQEWTLTLSQIKGKLWEWDVESITSPNIRGRVLVNVREELAHVYLYPDGSLLPPIEVIESVGESEIEPRSWRN